MDPRKVGDVHEVVDHPGGGRAPHLHRHVQPAEGRVAVPWRRRDGGGRLVERHPDQAVAFLAGDGREVSLWGDRGVDTGTRDRHTGALGIEDPAVVGTLDAAIDGLARRQWCVAMRATIGKGDGLPVGIAEQHDLFAAERSRHGFGQLVVVRYREPGRAHRRRRGEVICLWNGHRSTLSSCGEWRLQRCRRWNTDDR